MNTLNDENNPSELLFDTNSEISIKVKEIIDEKIQPIVGRDGGEVIFHGLKDKQVVIEFKGSSFSLMSGIQNMITHVVGMLSTCCLLLSRNYSSMRLGFICSVVSVGSSAVLCVVCN